MRKPLDSKPCGMIHWISQTLTGLLISTYTFTRVSEVRWPAEDPIPAEIELNHWTLSRILEQIFNILQLNAPARRPWGNMSPVRTAQQVVSARGAEPRSAWAPRPCAPRQSPRFPFRVYFSRRKEDCSLPRALPHCASKGRATSVAFRAFPNRCPGSEHNNIDFTRSILALLAGPEQRHAPTRLAVTRVSKTTSRSLFRLSTSSSDACAVRLIHWFILVRSHTSLTGD